MAGLDPGQLRPGMKVVISGDLLQVMTWELRTPGNLRSFVRCKMKHLKDGRVTEMTFRGSNEEILEADFETKNCQYLYKEQENHVFMELTTYEQFSLSEEFLGFQAQFLVPDAEMLVAFWDGKPVSLDLPSKMVLEVTDTIGDVVRGNSSGPITKEATLNTGLKVMVPSFVKIGDKVRVNTEDGAYVDRVN